MFISEYDTYCNTSYCYLGIIKQNSSMLDFSQWLFFYVIYLPPLTQSSSASDLWYFSQWWLFYIIYLSPLTQSSSASDRWSLADRRPQSASTEQTWNTPRSFSRRAPVELGKCYIIYNIIKGFYLLKQCNTITWKINTIFDMIKTIILYWF